MASQEPCCSPGEGSVWIAHQEGTISIDQDEFVARDARGVHRLSLDRIVAVEARHDPSGVATLSLWRDDGGVYDFLQCRPLYRVDEILTELATKRPTMRTGWITSL